MTSDPGLGLACNSPLYLHMAALQEFGLFNKILAIQSSPTKLRFLLLLGLFPTRLM